MKQMRRVRQQKKAHEDRARQEEWERKERTPFEIFVRVPASNNVIITRSVLGTDRIGFILDYEDHVHSCILGNS